MNAVAMAERGSPSHLEWTAQAVAAALQLPGRRSGPASFSAVVTDSRAVPPGALFVALRGERFDGNEFAATALANGAAGVVVERPLPGLPPESCFVVPDGLRALGDLATAWRRRLPARIVGLTGSAGKTTTKELVAEVCRHGSSSAERVRATKGNLNNLVGMPLTLLAADGSEEWLVLEMGMNRRGEIARMTEIADPDFGVITNIGLAHAEGVGGTLADVAEAKGELLGGLRPDATFAVNTDDPWVTRLAAAFPGPKITFGSKGEVRAAEVQDRGLSGIDFVLELGGRRSKAHLSLVGVHNVSNALAAAALGHAMGFRLEAIVEGLAGAVGVAGRMQVVQLRNGVTLINDAYNANPSSVEAALETLRRLPGRRVAVLGEMRELGGESRRAHQKIGEHAASLGIDELIVLEGEATAVAEGARAAGMPAAVVKLCPGHAEAARAALAGVRPGDVILVKGSHGARMEEVVRILESEAPGAS